MRTDKAVLRIAEVLDVLVGHFIPDCGGDFLPKIAPTICKGCNFYSQCEQMTKARNLCEELRSLFTDEKYRLNVAYAEGFEDADRAAAKDNQYDPVREADLFAQYNRGYFDGAV